MHIKKTATAISYRMEWVYEWVPLFGVFLSTVFFSRRKDYLKKSMMMQYGTKPNKIFKNGSNVKKKTKYVQKMFDKI